MNLRDGRGHIIDLDGLRAIAVRLVVRKSCASTPVLAESPLLQAGIACLVVLLVSHLSMRFLEGPINRLKRHFPMPVGDLAQARQGA